MVLSLSTFSGDNNVTSRKAQTMNTPAKALNVITVVPLPGGIIAEDGPCGPQGAVALLVVEDSEGNRAAVFGGREGNAVVPM
ncbi:hypothetical protein [Mycolicibacter minnesotensis]